MDETPPQNTMIPAWIDGILQPAEKLSVHLDGYRHKAVSVFVLCGSQILIQQRAMGKYHTPGLWANTCCTHPNWDEPSTDCATRRLTEELGIAGLDLTFRNTVEYRAPVGTGMIEHEVVDIFTAEAPIDLEMDLNPDEVRNAKWVELADLSEQIAEQPEAFTPWLRIYLAEHASSIFGQS